MRYKVQYRDNWDSMLEMPTEAEGVDSAWFKRGVKNLFVAAALAAGLAYAAAQGTLPAAQVAHQAQHHHA